MSLYDLLAPGDDISYRKPPLDRPVFGRVIRRDGGRIILHRYREQVMSNREGLHAIFFLLSELVQTDEEDNVDQSHIVAIIFILTVAKLSSFKYSVEGISNVFIYEKRHFNLLRYLDYLLFYGNRSSRFKEQYTKWLTTLGWGKYSKRTKHYFYILWGGSTSNNSLLLGS